MIKRQPDPLNLRFLLLVVVPGGLATTLTEVSSASEAWPRIFGSVYSLALAISTVVLLRPLYKTQINQWLITSIIAAAAGAVRGASLWWVLDAQNLEGTSLASRITFSALSWALGITLAALTLEVVGAAIKQDRDLRSQLREASEKHHSLDAQLEWLLNARVEGLDKELADQLASLVSQLNDRGQGPGAFRAIARELRNAAHGPIRKVSHDVWRRTPAELKSQLLTLVNQAPNAALTVTAYLISTAANTLRVFESPKELWISVGGASALGVWLILTQKVRKLHHFSFAPIGIATYLSGAYLGVGADANFALSLSSAAWGQVVVYFSSVLMAFQNDGLGLISTGKRLSKERERVNWLALQVESQRLEIAKYLHAILQTRLMSYAMRMERNGLTERELEELTSLLQNPMQQFLEKEVGLKAMLVELSTRWAPVVKIEYSLKTYKPSLDSAAQQIIQEAVANSVRHGQCESIFVSVTDDEDGRLIEVIDDGVGPRIGTPGLGSSVFDSLATEWSLKPGDGLGAKLSARIL